MRTIICFRPFIAALGLAVFSSAGATEKAKIADTPAPAAMADAPVADARWNEIKGISFDARAAFFSGLKRLQAQLDEQISELVARRVAMKEIDNTKDWDFAMKELGNARSYLIGTGELIAKAIPESWTQDKERVGQAWVRAQTAYAKVKASTTR